MDTERHVIAEGSYREGLSWLLWAQQQQPHGAQPGTGELMSMIRSLPGSRRRNAVVWV